MHFKPRRGGGEERRGWSLFFWRHRGSETPPALFLGGGEPLPLRFLYRNTILSIQNPPLPKKSLSDTRCSLHFVLLSLVLENEKGMRERGMGRVRDFEKKNEDEKKFFQNAISSPGKKPLSPAGTWKKLFHQFKQSLPTPPQQTKKKPLIL